jgi:ubiquinone/menaquinone biosynthesis C-methylase UbiE
MVTMPRDTSYLAHDFARFYDWVFPGSEEEVPFYLALAREHGAPLLELACGTGRLTIPLAREGFAITGLDLSEEMLTIAREKLAREAPEVRARVRLLQGNMAGFDLPERFGPAFIPQASLFHVHLKEERRSCLAAIRRHLLPGGVVVVDLVPAETMAHQTVGKAITYQTGVNPATGKVTKEVGRILSIRELDQRVTVEHTYVEIEADGRKHRHVFVEDYTWATEAEMRGLLEEAGFDEVRVLGGYRFQPYDEGSERSIFVGSNSMEGGRE